MGVAKILFVGDIHLGRRSGRIPRDLQKNGILNPDELTPGNAWNQVVEKAQELQVQAVVLAGDVVDHEDAWVGALQYLQPGVERLVKAGIRVLAVVGNHDVRALPHLADSMPDFELIGRGGNWESRVIQDSEKRDAVQLVGWSFPRPEIEISPINDQFRALALRPDLPVYGVLHCELDVRNSHHAPVKRSDLESSSFKGWFLGHIHKPSPLDPKQPIGYLGSLMGLDPTETERHGPWLLTVSAEKTDLQQIPTGPLRWESLDVDASAFQPEQGLAPLITSAIVQRARQVSSEGGHYVAMGCRIRLHGELEDPSILRRALEDAAKREESITLLSSGIQCFVDKIEFAVRSKLDLKRVAEHQDPPGILAKALLDLENDTPEARKLVAEAREHLRGLIASNRHYHTITPEDLADEAIRLRLIRSGRTALEALLARPEAGLAERA